MRIYSLANYNLNNKIAFKASNPNKTNRTSENKRDENQNKPLPDWARRAMLLLFYFLLLKMTRQCKE